MTNNKYTEYEDESIDDYKDKLNVDAIVGLILNTGFFCYHCGRGTILLPAEKKDHYKQLTLDRLDDLEDHNINNVVISCLGCNVAKAKKMYNLNFKK